MINRAVIPLLLRLPNFSWRHRIPVLGREGTISLGDKGVITLGHTHQCQIAQELFWNDGKLGSPADRHALDIAVVLSRRATTFFDIGAYTGLFAMVAARSNPGIRSFAYEIFPQNFLVLYDNVIRNNLLGQVVPRLCGVADKVREMTIPVETSLGVLPSSFSIDWKFADGIQVPVNTLDTLHPDTDGPLVIKIDVEGFETEVLEGGRQLLERARPDIICEVLRRAPRIAELEDLLRSLDYRFYHITALGLVEREDIVPSKSERDWLFSSHRAKYLRDLGITTVNNN